MNILNWKKLGLYTLFVALMVVALAACSPAETPAAEEPAAAENSAAEESAVIEEAAVEEMAEEEMAEEEMAEEVVVMHPQGETAVTINPQRVVVFDYSTLDTLDALGLGDQVVGVMQGPLMPAHLEKYNGEAYTNVGSFFEADLEAVNALNPDLIIVALRTGPFYEDLSAIAPVVDTTVSWDDPYNAFQDYVTNIGIIFGKEAEAADALAAIDAQVEEARALAESTGYQGLIVLTTGGEVSGYGPGSRFGLIHDLLGVAPTTDTMVSETHGDTITFEFILDQNPDVIYALDRDATIGEEGQTAAQILDNELVNSTKAGASGNIVHLDGVAWYLAGDGLTTFTTRINDVMAGLETAVSEPMAEPTEVVITHPQGETTLMTMPERVVVFDYSTLDTLDALGLGDSVVGVMQGPLMPPHLAQYNGEAYTNIGSFFEADLEAVNALDPDLIIVALRTGPFFEDLSAIAPVVDTTVSWDDPYNTFQEYVTNIGIIFGQEAEAADALAAIDAQVAETQALAESSGYQGLIVLTSGGEVSGYGPGSRFGLIHDLLGVAPTTDTMVAETHGDTITFEFILEQNPDVIYVIDRDAAIGQEGDTAVQILDNELVNSTNAGSSQNIVYLDGAAWYIATDGLTMFSTRISEVASGLN